MTLLALIKLTRLNHLRLKKSSDEPKCWVYVRTPGDDRHQTAVTMMLKRMQQPKDETKRLHVLKSLGVLDSAPETFSQAVVTAAASIANTPTSIISLIDSDRMWLKARLGFDACESARDVSFCAHAVCDRVPLIVADAALDPRFADNPLVIGPPYICFYAGFPLVVSGQSVGALCVISDLPHTLDAGQRDRLTGLADGVAAWLRLRAEWPPGNFR